MVVSRHNDIVPHVVIYQLLVLGLLQAGLLPGAGLAVGGVGADVGSLHDHSVAPRPLVAPEALQEAEAGGEDDEDDL